MGCVFSTIKGIKNGKAFFVEGKERNFVQRETNYFKVGKRKNPGQNLNVKEKAVEGLWKRKLCKGVLMCGQIRKHLIKLNEF